VAAHHPLATLMRKHTIEVINYGLFCQRLVYDIAEKETKLHRAARRLDELRMDSTTHTAFLSHTADLSSALDAISQLKYRAIEARQKTESEIEQREEETVRPVKPAALPQLPVLPSSVEELKQKIALHNVSSV